MQLPNETKYLVASSMRELATNHLVDLLQVQGLRLSEMQVVMIQPLVFSVRLKPQDGGAPRHITVKVSEAY